MKWYAVQHGDNYDWDYGDAIHEQAYAMADEIAKYKMYDGEEIRIATIENDVCIDEEIVREGTR